MVTGLVYDKWFRIMAVAKYKSIAGDSYDDGNACHNFDFCRRRTKKNWCIAGWISTGLYREQREQSQHQLQNIHQHLLFDASQTVDVLKADIRERVYEAHGIASGLYRAYPNHSEEELQSLISEALRDVRFNEGRGYFFIFSMEGMSVMHGLLPHIEGTSKIDAKDSKGTLILKEHIELIQQSTTGEAFYQWWYKKPGHGDIEFEKIGFGKKFEPFDWFIGTGEYVSDVEDEIKLSF